MSGTSYATTFVNPSSLDNARLDSCGPGTTSKVTVLNSGAQAAGYRVTVSYRDSIGHEVSVGVLDFTAVPGRSERTGRAPGPAVQASPVTCVLSDVVLAR